MPTSTPRSQRGRPVKCTACNRPMASLLYCDQCHSLYPADGLDYFELLGFERTYDIDAAALRQKYLQVSRGVHPDHHGESDSTLSLHVSAQLNEAHRVLSDPVLRAEYLLELHRGKSAREDKSVPQEVLATALMLREEFQEAREANDTAALEQARARSRQHYDETLARVEELARQLPGDEQVRQQLRGALNSVKYFQRLLAEG